VFENLPTIITVGSSSRGPIYECTCTRKLAHTAYVPERSRNIKHSDQRGWKLTFCPVKVDKVGEGRIQTQNQYNRSTHKQVGMREGYKTMDMWRRTG